MTCMTEILFQLVYESSSKYDKRLEQINHLTNFEVKAPGRLSFYVRLIVDCNFTKCYNQNARAPAVLFIRNCFFTTFA